MFFPTSKTFFLLLTIFSLTAISSGFLLKNLGSGDCAKDEDAKTETTRYSLGPCNKPSTNFKLVIGQDRPVPRQLLVSAWTQPKGQKAKEKCAYANTDDSAAKVDSVWSSGCEGRQFCPYLQWTVIELNITRFMLKHPKSNRCLTSDSGLLRVATPCNETDVLQHWQTLTSN